MNSTKVALIGLGTMGAGMAGRLLAAGFPLTVYNRSAAKIQPLVSQGAKPAASPREAAQGTDIIISMVADDAASRQVWLSNNGALDGAIQGALLIECSTISPGWAEELAAEAAKRSCEFMDAPVTGSKPQAAAGQLLFLVGGTDQSLARARPVLAAMSRDIMHLGPVGSGALVKLINNMVCGVQVAAIAEALALIERTDLDTAKALSVLTDGAPGSPLVKALFGPHDSARFRSQLQPKADGEGYFLRASGGGEAFHAPFHGHCRAANHERRRARRPRRSGFLRGH